MKPLLTIGIWLPLCVLGQVRPPDQGMSNLPIQPIGANDLVAVSVYDAPEFTRTVRIGADGYMRLPMMTDRIRAMGLMPAELETVIAAELKKEGLIVDPSVTVTVAEYNSHPISVMGAVRKPLTFQAAGPVTLLDALARAEGLATEAGPEILVTRQSAEASGASLTQRIPVKGLMGAANSEMNLKLTGGEEIRVPEVGRVFVLGNVHRPGSFIAQTNSETTVLKALAMAEGLLPYSAKRVYIYRQEASGSKNEIPVELAKIVERKAPDPPLLANDVLYIPTATGTRAGLAALEKVLIFGSGAMSALIYAGVR